jgi:ribose transport system ATP-binding protein
VPSGDCVSPPAAPSDISLADSVQAGAVTSLLEARDVAKSFGNTHALHGVSLHVDYGEVIGLIGENGAGKSTLLHTISGNLRPDAGDVLVRGRRISFSSPRDANLNGVFHIYQELALVGCLPVFENLFLSHEDMFSRRGVLQRSKMRQRARETLAEFGHDWIDPSTNVDAYDFSTRQVIEIVKAFALSKLLEIESPIVLLDEPTARLNREEVDFFTELLGEMRQRAAIVFVSHRLSEVLELSDRVYVLRDGTVTAHVTPSEASEGELHQLMVGRARSEHFYHEHLQLQPESRPVLHVRGLSRPQSFHDVDLVVNAGEIVGVAGLVGSGKSDLAAAVFGGLPHTTGEISVDGVPIKRNTIEAMARAGVGYVPPDRHAQGVMLGLPISWNMSLAELAHGERRRMLLDIGEEEDNARTQVAVLGIKTSGTRALARTLSGGNQQKVLLARWLSRGVLKLLLLDNPTHGVDAGAKEDIYRVLRLVAEKGVGILLVSDDLSELIGLSNRIVTMKDGAVVGEIEAPPNAKPAEVELVAQML